MTTKGQEEAHKVRVDYTLDEFTRLKKFNELASGGIDGSQLNLAADVSEEAKPAIIHPEYMGYVSSIPEGCIGVLCVVDDYALLLLATLEEMADSYATLRQQLLSAGELDIATSNALPAYRIAKWAVESENHHSALLGIAHVLITRLEHIPFLEYAISQGVAPMLFMFNQPKGSRAATFLHAPYRERITRKIFGDKPTRPSQG